MKKPREFDGLIRSRLDYVFIVLFVLYCLVCFPENIGSGFLDVSLVLVVVYFIFVRTIPWKDVFRDPLVVLFLVLVAVRIFPSFYYDPYFSAYMLRKWPMRATLHLLLFCGMIHSQRELDSFLAYLSIPLIFAWVALGGFVSCYSTSCWVAGRTFEAFDVIHNSTAMFLGFFVPILLAEAYLHRSVFVKILCGSMATVGIVGVILTRSKGGIFALLFLLLVFGVLALLKGSLPFANFVGVVFTGTVVFVLVLSVSSGFMDKDLETIQRTLDPEHRRSVIWPASLQLIQKRPYLGFPPGSFGNETARLSGPLFSHPHNHTHNVFLQNLYEGGLLGPFLYAAVLVVFGRRFLRLYFDDPKYWIRGASMMSGIVCILVVYGLIEDVPMFRLAVFLSVGLVLLNVDYDGVSRVDNQVRKLRQFLVP